MKKKCHKLSALSLKPGNGSILTFEERLTAYGLRLMAEHNLHALLIIAFNILLLSCSGSGSTTGNVAGTGNSTGNVLGVIQDSSGFGIPNVIVSLVPEDYDPLSGDTLHPAWTMRTGIDGNYLMKQVTKGTYNLEAVRVSDNTMALLQGIRITESQGENGDTVSAPMGLLRKPGTIAISLEYLAEEEEAYIYIPGTNIYARIDSVALQQGFLVLEIVPPASYPSITLVENESQSDIDASGEAIQVQPLDTVVLGNLPTRVYGSIVTENGEPAANTLVMLVPHAYAPLPFPASLSDTTDAEGRYFMSGVDTGVYSVEALQLDHRTRLLQPDRHITGDSVGLPEDTLQPPGSLEIHVQEAGVRLGGYVYIPGTRMVVIINPEIITRGYIRLDSLPVGSYAVINYSESMEASQPVILAQDVLIQPRQTTVLGPYSAWRYRRTVIVNTSSTGAHLSGDVYNFPLLVRLDESTLPSLFTSAQDNGGDLRFSKLQGTPLAFEIEHWDAVNKRALIWVHLDTVYGESDSTAFYLYTGNSQARAIGSGTSVFDSSGYLGVWHMNQNSYDIVPRLKDASGAENHGAAGSASHILGDDSPIHKGIRLDGIDQYVATSREYIVLNEFSMSFWFRTASAEGGRIMAFSDSMAVQTEDKVDRMVWMGDSGTLHFGVYLFSQGGHKIVSTVETYNDSVWHYAVASLTPEGQVLYVDGDLAAENPEVTSDMLDVFYKGYWSIGFFAKDPTYWPPTPTSLYFKGALDEMRAAHFAAPADQVKLSWESQRPGSAIIRFEE